MGGIARTAHKASDHAEPGSDPDQHPHLLVIGAGLGHGSPVGLTATHSATGAGAFPHDSGRSGAPRAPTS